MGLKSVMPCHSKSSNGRSRHVGRSHCRAGFLLLSAALLCFTSNCASIDWKYHDVVITVRDEETGNPIPGAKLDISYPSFWAGSSRSPDWPSESLQSDASGRVSMQIADWWYEGSFASARTHVVISVPGRERQWFLVPPEILYHGGRLPSVEPWRDFTQPVVVDLHPAQATE